MPAAAEANISMVRVDFHVDANRAEAARLDYIRSGFNDADVQVIPTAAALLWSDGFGKNGPKGFIEDPARDRQMFIVIAKLRETTND